MYLFCLVFVMNADLYFLDVFKLHLLDGLEYGETGEGSIGWHHEGDH